MTDLISASLHNCLWDDLVVAIYFDLCSKWFVEAVSLGVWDPLDVRFEIDLHVKVLAAPDLKLGVQQNGTLFVTFLRSHIV